MGKRNRVTTRDIAEELGISQSTVSMILSNKPNVSFTDETVQKVKVKAKELGYKKPVPKEQVQEKSLANTIGRAMPDGHKRLLLDDDAVYHRSRKEI